jgi:hypothetical protein
LIMCAFGAPPVRILCDPTFGIFKRRWGRRDRFGPDAPIGLGNC